MTSNSKINVFIAAATMVFAWIFYIVANAVPSWSAQSVEGSWYSSSYGLWKGCSTSPSVTICNEWDCASSPSSTCSKVIAAECFVTSACLLSIFSAICLLLSLVLSDQRKSIVFWCGKIFAFVCLFVGTIGVTLGITALTGSEDGTRLSWGVASIIGIIAIIANLVGCIVSLFIP